MAEAARRLGHGSDVVRRLIARPIRAQSSRFAQPASSPAAPPHAARQAVETTPETSAETVEAGTPLRQATRHEATASPAADRLRTEMLLLKAVLRAERRENASLRACLGFDEADAELDPAARAVRDRWAALVDRLLHARPEA